MGLLSWFKWDNVRFVFPPGGTAGQVLSKVDGTDSKEWATPTPSIPIGGNDGEVLTKDGATDYATKWATASGGTTLPIGTIIRASQSPAANALRCDGSVYLQSAKPLTFAQVGLLHDFNAWTPVGTNNSNQMTRVAYGNSRFVSVENGSCKYSTDGGANWTRVANTGSWRGVAYSPTLDMWICVGDGGIMDYSTDGGANWSAVGTPSFLTTDIQGICWDSTNAVFVAVGASNKIATSPDGSTFTQQTSGVTATLYSVCHCPALGLTIAVGSGGILATSPNNTAWTQCVIGVAGINIYDVCWAADIGTALCCGQTGRVAYSKDGINWVPMYITHDNQIQSRIGTDGKRFLIGNYTSHEMTLMGADMVPRRVAKYTKFGYGGIAWGGGAWVIGGTDADVHAAIAAYSYNTSTSFRLPKAGLDAGIYSDSWILGDD